MINVHSSVQSGVIVNQDGQFDISELVARGNINIAVKATSKQGGEELSGGMEVDLPSLIGFCKRILTEAGTLPKWFFIGVIVDSARSQLLTYFSPSKEKFFSDIYQYIKNNLAADLPMADTETVIKNFFERNRDYHFNYMMIPLETLLTGSADGSVEPFNIRI